LVCGIEKALKVEDGAAYLQKIIQASFSVPRPEDFDLRRWFLEECEKLYFRVTKENLTEDVAGRLTQICDIDGGRLRTPRDVIQTINALRLIFPPLGKKVDFADLCWLQLIRVLKPELYEWTSEYLTTYAALCSGAICSEDEIKRFRDKLLELLPVKTAISYKSIWWFKQIIPGIDSSEISDEKIKIFITSDDNNAELEEQHRLASPHYYRLYFSFAQPSGTLDDALLEKIIFKANKGEDIQDILRTLANKRRPQGGVMYEVFIDRIRSKNLSPEASKNIIFAVADTIDDASRTEPDKTFTGRTPISKLGIYPA
jgi:predicted KAP-like P-loop ATPase